MVELILLLQPLLKRLHQLLEAAERLHRRHLLGRQRLLGQLAQPLFRQLAGEVG